jgi:chromatin remodeling complex protein RSC6
MTCEECDLCSKPNFLNQVVSGILEKQSISDELATFMGLSANSQASRVDVAKFISAYVKEHGCFDPSFKCRIVPDAALSKLLCVKDDEEVTYLNLQKFLKVHFVKTA